VTARTLVAVIAVGVGVSGLAALVVPRPPRLRNRVRPYAIVARTSLGRSPGLGVDLDALVPATDSSGIFRIPLRAVAARLGRALGQQGDAQLARLLRQAGMQEVGPDDARVRAVAHASVVALIAGAVVGVASHVPLAGLLAGVAGFTVGLTRWRRKLERAVEERAARLRLELYTVNQLIAMHARTGAGVLQAVQRIVDRGRGVVVDELADVLTWTRSGMGEAEAFRHAAELTAEPSASRTYQLLAAGAERGVDLATGLLALSEDIRDARREQLHKDAVRRRAAMLVPTIAILAPIMLLFIGAPLPSIVLGHH
jgi:Flp pilus assembly protein TadB